MGFILTILFTILSSYYDANLLKKGKYFIDHASRSIFRLFVLAGIAFFFNLHVFITIAIFYLIFDTSLNIFWGKKWNYIGQTSTLDKWWHRFGGWKAQYIFKIIFLIITINLKWILEFLENGLFGW
jgi:hypothetical protein